MDGNVGRVATSGKSVSGRKEKSYWPKTKLKLVNIYNCGCLPRDIFSKFLLVGVGRFISQCMSAFCHKVELDVSFDPCWMVANAFHVSNRYFNQYSCAFLERLLSLLCRIENNAQSPWLKSRSSIIPKSIIF